MHFYCEKGSLEWASWGDDHALFCLRTGETHIIGNLPAQVLRRLETSPTSAEELARDIASSYNETADVDWLDEITRILDDFQSLELIEKRP
jgi:PqqD family protein of HPr-rel-A system